MLRHLLVLTVLGLTLSPALAAPLFNAPSTSMMPTLGTGDVILAIPPERELRRGDIVVYFADGSTQLSRVVGLGKETVEIRSGQILIDGTPMALTELAPIEDACPPLVSQGTECHFLRETTPEGTSYFIIDTGADAFLDNVPAVTVPKDHVFLMSDNRDNSVDSRYIGHGTIAADSMLGLVDSIVTTSRLTPDRAERLAGFPSAQ